MIILDEDWNSAERKLLDKHLSTPERLLVIQGTKALILVRVPDGYDVFTDKEDHIAILE